MGTGIYEIFRYEQKDADWKLIAQVYGLREANFTLKQLTDANPLDKFKMVIG